MDLNERIIEYYITSNGKEPCRIWLYSIKDPVTRDVLFSRIERVRLGNFNQCMPVGGGVFEIRIFLGPGFRIYFSFYGQRIILLLIGGDKSTQEKDIKKAQQYWIEFQQRG